MTEETSNPNIKVTDRCKFDATGERRGESESSGETSSGGVDTPGAPPRAPAGAPAAPPEERQQRSAARPSGSPASDRGRVFDARADTRASSEFSDVAAGLASSFSLLVARLAQETEIYLGLVPYPGKENPEPDLEAARAMIDILAMLQEKTRGNLDEEETRLIENVLYDYRLEFVRRGSGGAAR